MQAVQPYDDMRRVLRLRRNYFWRTVSQTPFTLVVSFPEHLTGRIHVPIDEVDSMMSKGSNLMKYFEENYRLHPDWVYCRGFRKSFEDIKLGLIDEDDCEMSPEEELEHYLDKFEKTGWKWKTDKETNKLNSTDAQCDRKLLQLLFFDAKATEGFVKDFPKRALTHAENYLIKTTFISTHSGLLRYKIFSKKNNDVKEGNKFSDKMRRSIDEVWYKHAVDFNKIEPESFVYSVPFNAYLHNDTKITATSTIFTRDGSDKVPIAVVGFQFQHSKLKQIVEKNVSGLGGESHSVDKSHSIIPQCTRDKEEKCYILDDNAYILLDPNAEHTGKFFGSVEKKLMHILVEDGIYEPVRVFDYQAVCYVNKNVAYKKLMKRDIISSSALSVVFWNPFKYFGTVLATLVSTASTVFGAIPTYMANCKSSKIVEFKY